MIIKKIIILITKFFLFFLNSCSNLKPLYKSDLSSLNKLQDVYIISNDKKTSKKLKEFNKPFPNNKKTRYILKIEGLSETSGTVSDTSRKISRYKTQVSAKVKLYYRYKEYDKLIYEFYEKRFIV